MNQYAKKENFKKAIELRDQIEKLLKVFENAKIIREIEKKDTKTLRNIKKIFKLKDIPQKIEGYDVSNIYGDFATASMVSFVNGEPNKNEFRKFKIRINGKSNDTAMIKETLNRRFNHPEWPLPDFILIDGGKGQLNATLSVIQKRKLSIPVIALTKDKKHKGSHIFSSILDEKIILDEIDEKTKNLILHIDSEAHRFAITYYRKLHKKSIGK